MGNKSKIALLFLSLMIFAGGCASTSGNQAITDPEKLHRLVIGQTTENEVKQMFGEPEQSGMVSGNAMPISSVTIQKNGVSKVKKFSANEQFDQWTYMYSKSSASESPLNFIPYVGLFGHTDTKTDTGTLVLYFDHNGVLTYLNQNKSSSKCRAGITGSSCS